MIDSVTKNQLDYHEAQQLTLSSDLNTITHMYVCPKGATSYNKDPFYICLLLVYSQYFLGKQYRSTSAG